MPTNQYIPWATGVGSNVYPFATYAAGTAVQTGVQNGTADPTLANTTWRQASVVAAMIGQFTADHQVNNILDDGNVANFETNFIAALKTALINQSICYIVDSGTADALIGTPSPALTAYNVGQVIVVQKISAPNATTTPTININSLGAKPITKAIGTPLAAGDLPGNLDFIAVYDGTEFRRIGLTTSDVLALIAANAPAIVTANVTIYVRSDGSDTDPTRNGSQNTSASAFASIAAAINYGLTRYSFSGFQLNIQIGIPGTYAPPGPISGSTTINIIGNPSSPSTYIVSGAGPSGGGGGLFSIQSGSVVYINGFTINNTTMINHTLVSVASGVLSVQNVIFTQGTTSSTYNVMIALGGAITVGSGCVISGGTYYSAFRAGYSGGHININANIIFSGSPSFTATVSVTDLGGVFVITGTCSGSASGVRYTAATNSVIDSNGGGANYFPGTSAGTTTLGGLYA